MKPADQLDALPIGPPRGSIMTTNDGRLSFSVPSPYESHDPRLGLPICTLPVLSCRHPPACAAVSVCMDRITHRSSANFAVCGNRLEIGSPLSPCWVNGKGLFIKWPIGRLFDPTLVFPVYGLPSYFSTAGFGSKVSICDGAPFMNRKTACLALAGKCGFLATSGPDFSPACAGNPSRDSRSTRANPANPPPTCQRNSRRDRPQGVGFGMKRRVMDHFWSDFPASRLVEIATSLFSIAM